MLLVLTVLSGNSLPCQLPGNPGQLQAEDFEGLPSKIEGGEWGLISFLYGGLAKECHDGSNVAMLVTFSYRCKFFVHLGP